MKRKFAASAGIGFVLVLGMASGIRLFGQQNGNGPDRPNNPGTNFFGQSPPGRGSFGPDGGPSYNLSQLPSYDQPQQGYPIPPLPPFANGQRMEVNGQRMVPYTYTTRTPDGREVTATTMRPEWDVNRLHAGHQVLRDAQTKLRSPDATDSEKKEARESIAKYLKEEFERDQKMRREQVERLEEQVANLRKQLDKRQESQSKIIELRMQLLENEAEGLAFPESFNELNGFPGVNQPHSYSPVPYNTSSSYAPYYPYAAPYSPQQQQGFSPIPNYPQPQPSLGYHQSQPNNPPPNQKPKKDQSGPNVAKPIENRF